ncbi:hypothetical protein HYPSUDRAFT_60200 [Hypholoma sublateritium FD-334 SS-4]|uniref:Uncharacterized protein n=1 Tax=Hypholoma sublateritium (strain FD-334 SS-4) TaxID=945553 RepID=A0A0D2NWB3_HYPSF|nr:hypothetical protein HYPSUDRAFT_60200 [Hypholoma sublateritium FD-334 SS-4]
MVRFSVLRKGAKNWTEPNFGNTMDSERSSSRDGREQQHDIQAVLPARVQIRSQHAIMPPYHLQANTAPASHHSTPLERETTIPAPTRAVMLERVLLSTLHSASQIRHAHCCPSCRPFSRTPCSERLTSLTSPTLSARMSWDLGEQAQLMSLGYSPLDVGSAALSRPNRAPA